mmetsp:Transcript_40498/g.128156  ORF Transcript_40498/g.128156 Transcript_40498/m.128156 type:complete len:1542 (-) Transcript_40498:50-4675(-)
MTSLGALALGLLLLLKLARSDFSTAPPEATWGQTRSLVAADRICEGYDEQWGACADLPACSSCTPQDCRFADWSDWYTEGECTGIRFRRRALDLQNNQCGSPCTGAKIQSEEDPQGQCLATTADCAFSPWSAWSQCNNPEDQAMRERKIQSMSSKDGTPCTGSVKETKACSPVPVSVPCQFAPWQEWTSCSATCGSGRHTRMRRIDIESANGGATCNDAVLEAKICSVSVCPGVDCQVGDWSSWSVCDRTHPQQYRSRSIQRSPINGGAECPSELSEIQGCSTAPEDCTLSAWTEWSACDKSCFGGQKYRERNIASVNDMGGRCGSTSLRQVAACNDGPCFAQGPVNCQLSEWMAWSACSSLCGAGTRSRKRIVQTLASPDGSGCGSPLEEVGSCLDTRCGQADCRWGDWQAWSACSATCGGGSQSRGRGVAVWPLNGGALCVPQDSEEVASCNAESCLSGCFDGAWGAWMEWTQCSASCSSGFRSRHRDIELEPNACGLPAVGLRDQFEVCSSLSACIEDRGCALSEWGDWSHCSCSCFGIRERNRYIMVFASGQGKPCSDTPLRALEPCYPGTGEAAPPVCGEIPARDCLLGDWHGWSTCTAACGGGQTTRDRALHLPAASGGQPCLAPLVYTTACNTQPCVETDPCIECLWGEWTEWGDCAECGSQRLRERSIEHMNNHCGQPCDIRSAKELGVCTSACQEDLFCSWTEWSDSATCLGCGASTTIRMRMLGLSASMPSSGSYLIRGGKDTNCAGSQLNVSLCPIYESCIPKCIPMHCTFNAWSDWQEPTCVGLCERRRVIGNMNNDCGDPCAGSLLETKRCLSNCQQPRDCSFSEWSNWSECPGGAVSAYSQRTRNIIQLPENDGNPCVGPLSESRDCSLASVADCLLGEWSFWSECSQPCGTGYKSRNRAVAREAANGGNQCFGTLEELELCVQSPDCSFVSKRDCAMSLWSEWSICDGERQRYRDRSVQEMATDGGAPCVGVMMETESCRTKHADCQVSEWTSWGACGKTCGGGQAARQRQIVAFPAFEGASCPSELMEVKGCNTQSCVMQDCQVALWSDWGTCATSCGSGQQMRSRQVLGFRGLDGRGCDLAMGETRQCADTPKCDFADCKWGDWSDWSGCTCSCAGGQQSRNRHIVAIPRGGGKPCEAVDKDEMRACNTQKCEDGFCQDGIYAEWTGWAPCSVSCGGGVTFRARKVEQMANACGREPLGKSREETFCNVGVPCSPDVDCVLSTWSIWGACSSSCDGVMGRARAVRTYGRGGGAWCMGDLKQTWPCNSGEGREECGHANAVDCQVSEWEGWSACGAECGGGEHTRSRSIMTVPQHGGMPCPEATTVVEDCSREPCNGTAAVDCVLGEWEDWGACGKCSGERRRFRSILQYSENGGKSCPPFDQEESAPCPRQCQDSTYCSWNEWGDWYSCSATCGKGAIRGRRRYLHVESDPAVALQSNVTDLDVISKYETLYKRAQDLEGQHSQNLASAFVGGCASVAVVLAVVHGFAFGGWGRRHDAVDRFGTGSTSFSEVPLVSGTQWLGAE